MMKRVILCLLILTIMLLCTGCPPKYVFLTDYFEASYFVDADVPFADSAGVLGRDTVRKLEEDEYGRCLYSYKTYSSMLWHKFIEIYIISQKETQAEIHYYPDYCYIARFCDGDSFSEEEIMQLKGRNDWGKSLNEEKMRMIPNDDLGRIIPFDDLYTTLFDYFGVDREDTVKIHPMEINDANQQMVCCLVTRRTGGEGEWITRRYILVCQEDSYHPIVAIEEVENSIDCQDVMHEFRTTWFEPEL